MPIQPCADAEELYLNFRRHPSFAVYCGGNEGTFGQRLCERFSREIRARDPDRLVIEQDTGKPPKWKTDANFRTALWWYAHHIQQSCRLT